MNPPTGPPHIRDTIRIVPFLASRHLTFFPSFHVAAVFVSCFASFHSSFPAEAASHSQLNNDEAGSETNETLALDTAHRLIHLDTTPTTEAAIPQGFSTFQQFRPILTLQLDSSSAVTFITVLSFLASFAAAIDPRDTGQRTGLGYECKGLTSSALLRGPRPEPAFTVRPAHSPSQGHSLTLAGEAGRHRFNANLKSCCAE